MNNKALEKVKTDLYISSGVVKKRLELIEKYKEGIENIVCRMLGKSGEKIIKKYSDFVNKENHLVIPGRVHKRCSYPSKNIYLNSFDAVDIEIPTVISNINNTWWCSNDSCSENFTEDEKNWWESIKKELEENSYLVNNLWEEIVLVFQNISELQLKNFPEAYKLYKKYRKE